MTQAARLTATLIGGIAVLLWATLGIAARRLVFEKPGLDLGAVERRIGKFAHPGIEGAFETLFQQQAHDITP